MAGEEFKDTTGLAERDEVNGSSVREHRVYHGSGADFDAFDHSHMGEGEGAQAYGWGTYVTEVEGIIVDGNGATVLKKRQEQGEFLAHCSDDSYFHCG